MSANIEKLNRQIEGASALFTFELTVLLLDISASMSDRLPFDISDDGDVNWVDSESENPYHDYDNISGLKDAVKNFIISRRDAGGEDKTGVITFNREPKLLWEAQRKNYDVLLKKVDGLMADGGTNMVSAIRMAMSEIFSKYNDGFFRMVVLSDGQPSSKEVCLSTVKEAFELLGIITDTIAVGKDCDVPFMRALAEIGGGTCTEVHSYKAMLGTFKQIQAERKLLFGDGVKLLGAGELIIDNSDTVKDTPKKTNKKSKK